MAEIEYKLSPSTINLYVECPRCFWLKVNKGIKRPSGPFPSLPSGVDDKIKNYFDNHRVSGSLPEPLKDFEKDLDFFRDGEFLSKARNWRQGPKWITDEFILRGGVDDLLRHHGDIVVLDYKTRGYEPDGEVGAPSYYERQVNLYNLMLHKNGYSHADFGLLLYFYPEGFEDGSTLDLHTEVREIDVDLQKAEELVREAVATLKGPIPEHSEKCDYKNWDPR